MAYEVTATRRRPQKFEDLVGQEFVVATLKNSIQSGKIAHAYLFSGPRGCGKTSSARILAKALNCQNGPIETPCENCTCCKEITKGSCIDVIEIDGASNTSVNDIRQIKDEILFPPNSSRYKIYIIDEVHMLSTSAFNALLKTIEEPPEYVIFIFATTELHKVPATIKSRCQQFHFRLGNIEQIKDLLEKACQDLNIQADEEALYWIARESTGSFRDAYTLFDQVVAFSENQITYEKIRDKLGLVGTEHLNEISELCIEGNSMAALEKLDQMFTRGISMEQFISNYTDYLRSVLLIKSGITKESLLGQSISRYSQKVLDSWNITMIERALSLFLNLYRDIRYSLSPRYETELAISRMCWLTQFVSNNEVKNALDQAKNLLLSSGSQGETPPFQDSDNLYEKNSAKIIAEQKNEQNYNFFDTSGKIFLDNSNDNNKVNNSANLTLEQLKEEAKKQSLRTCPLFFPIFEQSENWIFDNDIIKIPIENAFLQNQIDSNAGEISIFLSKLWKKQIRVQSHFIVNKIEKEVSEDYPAVIKNLKEAFRGEIISVSVCTENSNTGSNEQNKKNENTQSSIKYEDTAGDEYEL
ncbi:MAG: DNA polymerase III subunit gamma/tau [Treponemataceae bacterium]